jgi:arylamine N-acetyltransferase
LGSRAAELTTREVFDRYLQLLGVERAVPCHELLSELVRAQLIRVPFENVSKLYLRMTRGASFIPSLEEHLEGIERWAFGGTCYANNPHFATLLRNVGFEVDICGAAMSRPDVHVVSIVRLDGIEYLVDVGYGAPFFAPMRVDLDREQEVVFGRSRFVLHPRDGRRRSRLDHYRDGRLIHGYEVDPQPRALDYFGGVIRESYSKEATFMKVVVVERFSADHSIRIHNFELTESTHSTSSTTRLNDRDELVDALARLCGFPAEIVRDVVAGLPLEGEIYG